MPAQAKHQFLARDSEGWVSVCFPSPKTRTPAHRVPVPRIASADARLSLDTHWTNSADDETVVIRGREGGRNKLIYALASWAVVVSADAQKGGTWTGATENLCAGWVPLFVRDDVSAPQGNRELVEQGGRPIRGENLSADLAAWFAAHAAAREPMLVREQRAAYDLFTEDDAASEVDREER